MDSNKCVTDNCDIMVKIPFKYCFDCNSNRKKDWKLCTLCYEVKIDPTKPYKTCYNCSSHIKQLRANIKKI